MLFVNLKCLFSNLWFPCKSDLRISCLLETMEKFTLFESENDTNFHILYKKVPLWIGDEHKGSFKMTLTVHLIRKMCHPPPFLNQHPNFQKFPSNSNKPILELNSIQFNQVYWDVNLRRKIIIQNRYCSWFLSYSTSKWNQSSWPIWQRLKSLDSSAVSCNQN